MFNQIVAVEKHFDFRLEDVVVSSMSSVLFHSSDEPPAGVSAVVPGVVSGVEEVWNETVP